MHTYTLTISYPNNATSVQEQGGEFNGYVYLDSGNNQIYDNITWDKSQGQG